MQQQAADEALLERAKTGDAEAISALIERYHPDLKKFAQGVCQTSEDAEDAVQHAMIVVSTKLGLFKGLSKFSTWLFAVIKYECFRLMRRMRGHIELSDSLADPRQTPDERVEQADLLEKVRSAIAALEPDYREVFLLRDVEGHSGTEVAAKLGLSLPAVKSRLHRARLQVKDAVG